MKLPANTLAVALESAGMNGGAIYLADLKVQRLRLYVQMGLPDKFVEEVGVLRWGKGHLATWQHPGRRW